MSTWEGIVNHKHPHSHSLDGVLLAHVWTWLISWPLSFAAGCWRVLLWPAGWLACLGPLFAVGCWETRCCSCKTSLDRFIFLRIHTNCIVLHIVFRLLKEPRPCSRRDVYS
ncbi:hypothetical protein B0T24DRAFT_620109 [Lasiosphaeria ovina]|uniref:Uncharacterized protein n=1 Tax=Lasiosphaeria ovina TaxID=92902 RepID=A0AAE0KHS1_9PEZI|nr:hypothetical protein B0T24DRAFT_620109 [Lasiosphaeria ovina]